MIHKINSKDVYGVVCHDAGAANQVLPYLSKRNFSQILGYFQGPSVKSHTQFFPDLKLKSSLDELVQNSSVLITGTGWSSILEHETRKLAKEYNKYCIAIVDHWVNYKERFERLNEVIYPDEIWVFDREAFQRAKTLFPKIPVLEKKSIYEELLISEISTYCAVDNEILYICEPLRKLNEMGEPLEFSILFSVLQKINNNAKLRKGTIRLRLHPSEGFEKYDALISRFPNLMILKDNYALSKSIGNVNIVIGCSSYALYLAHRAGRKIISAFPKDFNPGKFDMRSIIPMSELLI
jgi:hypothetical protein